MSRAVMLLLATLTVACGARSGLLLDTPEPAQPPSLSCSASPAVCVKPGPSACSAASTVAPICDAQDFSWRCPEGSRVYARGARSGSSCLPFTDPALSFANVSGSLPAIPLDNGRCLWLADSVRTSRGQRVENVGLVPDLSTPFGACPASATYVSGKLESIVELEGGDDPSVIAQITGAYRLEGTLRILYRLFRRDPSATFGTTLLGSGMGRWDPASSRIVVGGLQALRFSADLDLGNGALVDDPFAYVWGCSGPGVEVLTSGCVLGRFDAQASLELFAGAGRWLPGSSRSDAATLFDDGPWISSLLQNPTQAGLLHVYTVGFARNVSAHGAAAITGPWAGLGNLAACDLPGDDRAYCQGPAVHAELSDPTRPGELVVSLRTGSTSGAEYWTRLTWLSVP